MATGDRAVAIRAKAGWASVEIKSSCFSAVSLGFATDAPRGSAGSFTPLRALHILIILLFMNY
jgi:hypothetical protein